MPDPTRHPISVNLHIDRYLCTLEPLRTEGRDALQPIPGIRKIKLREIEIHWQNAPDDITIHKADDLFERAAALADEYGPIFAKATLVRAMLDFEMEGSERPHKVSLCPPNTITVEAGSDISVIKGCLEKCRLILPCVASTIALAVLTLSASLLVGDDKDTADDYTGVLGCGLSVEALKG